MQSLAVKYRPRTFEECLGQTATLKILKKQLETKTVKNCYLFCGPSGTGKTTTSRAFANLINNGQGTPIEIDGASNNGVDNVRQIIEEAQQRSIDSEYKIFIIDEAHAISNQGWQAFLKCIEEPPKYTIFMFCTTNPEKIPNTIQNRVMRFNLTKVNSVEIKGRLKYICDCEGFTNYEESIDYISKICNGGVRDAISLLEKSADYSKDLDIRNVLEALGTFSYKEFLNLTNAIIDLREDEVLKLLGEIEYCGKDAKAFVESYLDFIVDLVSYCLFNDMGMTKLPLSLETDVKYSTKFEKSTQVFNLMIEKLLTLKNDIRFDTNVNLTIKACFINLLTLIPKIWEN